MVDFGAYLFKGLNRRKKKLEELFTDAYVKEVYDSEHVRTATKGLHVILDAKYEQAYLNKVTETQCQHLTMTQRNDLLELLQKFEELSDGTLGTWEKDPVYFDLKEDAEPICLRSYPVPKVNEEIFKK